MVACGGEDGANSAADGAKDGGGATDAGPAGDPTNGRKDLTWAPDKLGPYNVGFRTYKHTYNANQGDIPERELTVNLWYPTDAKEGEEPTYFGTWSASFYYAFANEKVVLDAKAAAPAVGDKYPVLAVSHGASGFGGSTAFLHHYFASHGWVVVAPDHLTDTLSDVGKKSARWLRLARPLDVSAAVDSLTTLPADTLAGTPDTTAIAFAGHSRGGVTTWAASGAVFDRAAIEAECKAQSDTTCTEALLDGYAKGARDKRVVCGIPMAGAGGFSPWFGEAGHSKAAVPQLQLSGDVDKDDPQKVFDASAPVPVTWVDIKDGCHQAFALGVCKDLKKTEGFPIIDAYALAFARYHVLTDRTEATTKILDGSATVSTRVTFKRRK